MSTENDPETGGPIEVIEPVTVHEIKEASLIPTDEDKVEIAALSERFYISPEQVIRSPARLAEITKAIGYRTPAEILHMSKLERDKAVNEGVLE